MAKVKIKKTEESSQNEFFEIDKDRLDEEWVNQPRLYYKYARRLEEARSTLEQAKARVELIYAELDSRIRAKPEKFKLEKITDAAVKAVIQADEDYRAALTDMHNAREDVGTYQVAVGTLDHKKKALENLVDLRLADYFSEPRTKESGERKKVRRHQEQEDGD